MAVTRFSPSKWIGVGVAIFVLISISAPLAQSNAGSLPGPKQKTFDTIRIGAVTEPDSVNPYVGVSGASYNLWSYIYELPFALSPDLLSIPGLVESYDLTADKLTWTFHLRQNVTWQDAAEFTAEDVNFTLRFIWAQTPWNPIGCDLTIAQSYIGDPNASPPVGIDVNNITVLDKYTIRMRTWQTKANMLSLFVYIVPKHLWSGIDCRRVTHLSSPPMIGTGMYKFTTWQHGVYIQLDLYEKYWRLNPNEDYVDRIIIQYYKSSVAVFDAFRAGDIQVTFMTAAQYGRMPDSVAGGTNNVRKYAYEYRGFSEMGACLASDALIDDQGKRGGRSWLVTNLTVRQALQYAVNRSILVEKVNFGLASPGSTIITPATSFWHYNVTKAEEYGYDPARARAILDDPKGDGAPLKAGQTEPGKFGQNIDPTNPKNKDAFIDIDGDGIRDVVDPTQVVAGDYWNGSFNPSKPNRAPLSSNGGGLIFDISIISTDTTATNAIEGFMVGWWAEVGVRVSPVLVSYSRQITVTYDCSASLYSWGWGCDPDPDFCLSIMITTQILYWQDAWYSNPVYDDLYRLQQTQVDLNERRQTIFDMQRIVYRDAAYLIYWYDWTLAAVRTDLFTNWGDWAAHPGLDPTDWAAPTFLFLQLRATGAQVNNPPTKPVIEGTPPITTFVGDPQGFVGTSTDPENDPLTWTWSWDDGNSTVNSTASGVSQVTTTHAWSQTDSYNVTLTVDDGVNLVTSDPFQVLVVPRPAEVGWIAGTVLEAGTLTSISGATVTANPGGFSRPTDSQGRYNITVPVGTYSVTASHSLYASRTEANVAVQKDRTTTLNFELASARGWLAGKVTSSAGGALAGVTVRATGVREFVTTTNEAGEYNRTVAPGTYSVTASLSGYREETVTGISVATGATTQHDFVLAPIAGPAGGLSPLGLVGISLGILVVVIALAAWAVVRRRKREEEIVGPPMPPGRPPTPP